MTISADIEERIERIIERSEGLQRFSRWPKPLRWAWIICTTTLPFAVLALMLLLLMPFHRLYEFLFWHLDQLAGTFDGYVTFEGLMRSRRAKPKTGA